MTDKELLYIEDALGHEEYFKTACKDTINQIQDTDLKMCVQQLEESHQQIYKNFHNLLHN